MVSIYKGDVLRKIHTLKEHLNKIIFGDLTIVINTLLRVGSPANKDNLF